MPVGDPAPPGSAACADPQMLRPAFHFPEYRVQMCADIQAVGAAVGNRSEWVVAAEYCLFAGSLSRQGRIFPVQQDKTNSSGNEAAVSGNSLAVVVALNPDPGAGQRVQYAEAGGKQFGLFIDQISHNHHKIKVFPLE